MIYFDATAPLLLVAEQSFDGYAVDVDNGVAEVVFMLNEVLVDMRERIYESGAPEDYAQELAEDYVARIRSILGGEESVAQSYNQ